MELAPTIHDEFEIGSVGIVLNFERNGENGVTGFGLSQDRMQGITFSRSTSAASANHNIKDFSHRTSP